jgi:hypothetical protein
LIWQRFGNFYLQEKSGEIPFPPAPMNACAVLVDNFILAGLASSYQALAERHGEPEPEVLAVDL